MFQFYAHLTEGTLALLVIGVSVAVSAATLWLSYRTLPRLRFQEGSDALGQIYGGAIGTIFALVFALVTIAVWQNYESLNAGVDQEANVLNDLHRNLEQLPQALRAPAQAGLTAYVDRVVTVEWPMMASGGEDPGSGRLLADLDAMLRRHPAARPGELPAQQERLQLLDQNWNLRRNRIRADASFLDPAMWLTLWAGSGVLLFFSCLLNMASRRQHYLMHGILGASMGLFFFLLLVYNHPFSGPGAISSAPLRELPERLWAAR